MKNIAERLVRGDRLGREEYRALLLDCKDSTFEPIHQYALQIAQQRFGGRIYIRGLIEISSFCRNNCLYCGLRRDNREAERYRLTPEQIYAAAEEGYRVGFRTLVLQGGEDPWLTDQRLVPIVEQLRQRYPDTAITLSLGERSEESYRRLFEAGANRYLLRHEAASEELYRALHPKEMSHAHRMEALRTLKRIGYQTGMGMMVGPPGQRVEHLVEDLLLLEEFQPEMVGIGPFLPHHQTPFAREQAGDLRLTLRLLSLVRILLPKALIPATTALASLSSEGRRAGILAGANVVMPNLSPPDVRAKYAIYDHKASWGKEAAEGLKELSDELATIGYTISYERGDHPHFNA